jgi:cellulose synthase/poly-beta-1,6-N-acetylglucosamine synthase-like glycosyltransferase
MIFLNGFYTLNLIISAFMLPRYKKRFLYTKGFNIRHNVSKPVSLLIPAYNEEITIVESAKSFLSIDYEDYEVILINDGSKDNTLNVLIDTFQFEKVEVEPNDICESKPIKAVYFSKIEPKLVLVDKENGGKADAQNGGARVARYPYVCMVDADTLLDKDSLHNFAIRLTAEPNLAAMGGIVRVSNGCQVKDGTVVKAGMPRRFIERIQVMEYLRAFLFGRISLTAMNALMIISGAFGIFRRDAFMKMGGWNGHAIGEDIDAVIHLHRIIYDNKLDWKVDFVPCPISWTQVPMTWKSLASQRERWQRGLMQVMLANKKMLMNPRYGAVGLIGFPYFAIFEMFSAVIEFACYPLTIAAFIAGAVNVTYMIYFLSLTAIWGLCISFCTILMHENIPYRYETTKDLISLLLTALFEGTGYRQIHSYWRLKGTFKYIFDKSSRSSGMKGWEAIQRASFTE